MADMQITKRRETMSLDVEGVKLTLELDYDKGTASFVNEQGQPERFEFNSRTRNYLGGWVRIFRALEQATIKADELLDDQQAVRDARKKRKMINIFTAISALEEGDDDGQEG